MTSMNAPSSRSSATSSATRPSLAFRLSTALLAGLFVMLLLGRLDGFTSAAALAAALGVFALSSILLSFLILAIPPGLFVLAMAGLLVR